MTKDDLCKQRGYQTYDCSLPQGFFDEVLKSIKDPDELIEGHPWSHFVWLYKMIGSSELLGGVPAPLTMTAELWLKKHQPQALELSKNAS